MKIKIVTKEVVAALRTVAAVTGHSLVTITAGKRGLRLAAQGKTNLLILYVPATVETPGEMTVESYMFSQAIKNRAEVTVSTSDNQAVIVGKSLSVKLVTAPVEPVASLEKKEGQELDAELQLAFADCTARVGITNVHDNNPIGYRVRIDKTGMHVVVADAHHMASAHHQGVKSKTSVTFTMAAEAFATISTVAGKEAYKLQFTDSELMAWSNKFELRMPTLAEGADGPTEEAVSTMVAGILAAKPPVRGSVEVSAFYDGLDTLHAIFEGGANVHLTTVEKGLQLKFQTSYGEAKALVAMDKTRGKFAHQIDLPLARDTFNSVKSKNLDFGIKDDNVLFVIEKVGDIQCTYLMVLVTQ
jgi:hypothetical protein